MREPRGKILLETMKSQKSSQVVPSANGWKWNTLKPRAVVSARRKTPVPQTTLPFGRDQPVSSRIIARIFSHTPRTVDIAANTMNRKNKEPQMRPPDMLLKTAAIVSNRRLGPAFTSRLKVKHAGKIITPARKATSVSSVITWIASPIRECSLPI